MMKQEIVVMKNLTAYVDHKNFMQKLFGKPSYSLSNPADLKRLMDSIECDLSPENLTCDGEVYGAALIAKARHLNTIKKDLATLIRRAA